MATVSYSYRSQKPTAQIEVRLTLGKGRNRSSFYTRTKLKEEISKDFWNDYKANVNFRDTIKANLKVELENHLHELESFIIDEVGAQTELSTDWLKNKVNDFYNPIKEEILPTTLIEYFEYYLNYRKHEIKEGTGSWKKWQSMKRKVKKMEVGLNRKYQINQVNENFVNEWVQFFETEKYTPKTIVKNFTYVKTVCLHAKFKGLETSPELEQLKVKLKEEPFPKIYLSFEELKAISNLNGLPDYLENAKDWLIISCYTGQRISDFMRFDNSMIRTTKQGKFIDLKQKKTGKEVTVPILPEVEEILQKRNGAFPRQISDQRYNDYIKEICNRAEIDELIKGKLTTVLPEGTRKIEGVYPKYELITSHVGRRSFATNFYGKIPTTYLKNITGHSTESMLLKYIGKSSNDTATEALELMLNVNR